VKESTYQSIINLLESRGVTYRAVHHEPTRTSEESAKARGEDVRIGGKALLVKTGDDFRLFVLSAALKLDSDAVKQRFAVKKIRFATPEELLQSTGLVPGSVPPFGRPILPFDLYVDESILANDKIAFNAGSLTDSLILATRDYMNIVEATVFKFGV
jgi:prolyl-tRNA editing enzyme YbaK/EbsC (Cys-tRNA(Pro) deacylase)